MSNANFQRIWRTTCHHQNNNNPSITEIEGTESCDIVDKEFKVAFSGNSRSFRKTQKKNLMISEECMKKGEIEQRDWKQINKGTKQVLELKNSINEMKNAI